MNRIRLGHICLFATLLTPLALQAQSLSEFQNLTPEEKRAYWDAMSEEEREAFRQKMREKHPGPERKHRPREPQA